MKFYLTEAYKDIPKYAEVTMIDRYAYDSGYPVCIVRYKNSESKPNREFVMSDTELLNELDKVESAYNKLLLLAANTIYDKKLITS